MTATLMMDNTMPVDLNDVDDLFGDGVGLSLPERSHSKPLLQRVDGLRSRGCCQAVAWSKAGTIATITPDGQSLELRFLRCHPDNGSWDLSEPTTCDVVKGSPGIPLVHLEWGATNSPELAVVDSVGRLFIVSFSISLNHPFIIRKWETDPIDDAYAVVGCHWLAVAPPNQQKPYNVMYGPATKNGNTYQYESSIIHASGPNHPHSSKSALFCVTTSGLLKMFWSQNTNRMEETIMELESVNSSDDLITHAALASDQRFLLVAVATSSGQLRLLKVEIQWGGPGSQPDKNPLPQNARLSPSLVEKQLAATTWLQNSLDDANDDASMAELSHLHVLPSLMDNTGKITVPPMIVTIRTRVPTATSYQMAQSVLDRWEAVVEPSQNLHPAFEQLGTQRSSESMDQTPSTRLRKLEPIIIHKAVIGFQAIQFGKVLVLTMADGTMECRDRLNFEEIYATEDTSRVMVLRQAGWTFTEDGPCQQIAFSPTHCSMIQMTDDGRIRWSKLHSPLRDTGKPDSKAYYSATVAALTVTVASAMWYHANYDDILAIVQQYSAARKRFIHDWISEIIRILKIQVDYSEELHHDSLMRNSPLQCCLSIMNSLGFRGEMQPRSFHSKFAMVDLNVRNVVILITLASNTPVSVREKMSPLDEHEVVDALAGCAKWTLDLLSWLTDSLFRLMNDADFQAKLAPGRLGEMTIHLHERNDVSLHLLLSSCSRSFLLAACRRIEHLEALSTKAIDFYRRQSAMADQGGATRMANPQLQQAYQRMQSITTSSLIKVGEFEKLLNVLGSDIRQSYQAYLPNLAKQPNAPKGKPIDVAIRTYQIQFELGMLLGAPPPPGFLPVIKKLFSKDLPAIQRFTDPANLFFAEFDLLGVQDDGSSLVERASRTRSVHVDLFKKGELRVGSTQQWRRCTRCASVMEDVFGSRPGFTFVLNQQRKCSCGGLWALLPRGKLII